MKKVYLLFALSMLGYLTGNAQLKVINIEKGKNKARLNSASVARHTISSQSNHSAAVIWSDDFSNPLNWDVSHSPNASADDWVIGTAIPNGSFPIDPIMSASAANGYALFDSDLLCSGDQVANLTTVNPIDLTGHSNVRLEFSQYYRRFHDSSYVYVSTDGSTWTKFEVNGNLTANQFSANNNSAINPEVLALDISSVAGNQDSVWIRFQFYSPDTNLTGVDTSAGCGYSWMIDDVSISDLPQVDGILMTPYCGEYTVLPVLQNAGFKLRGKFINNGSTPITGAKIYFTVTDPLGNFYYDTSSASGTINPTDTSGYLNAVGSYLPTEFGLYLVDQTLAVPGDSTPSNDMGTGFIVVDDSSYARDFTAIDVQDFRGTVGFDGAPISFGHLVQVYQNSQFTSVSFYVNGPTLGDRVTASIYTVASGNPGVSIGSTAVYNFTVDDTGGAFLTLPFSSPVTVNAGLYCVVINQLDTNNLTLGISNNVYTPNAGFFNLDGAGWSKLEVANLKLALMLRVNNPEGTLNGIKDPAAKTSVFNVFPNPSTDVIYVTGKGNVEKGVTINILNTAGQVVKTEYHDTFMYSRIDLSSLPSGVYTISIRNSSGEENKSIVIQ